MRLCRGPKSALAVWIAAVALAACSESSSDTPSSGGEGGASSGGSAGTAGDGAGGALGGSSGGGTGGGTAGTSGAGAAGRSGGFDCTSDGTAAKMVGVPAGEFIMGCNEAVDGDCLEDEKPMRTVFVSAFEIDVTEVTQDQYAACVAAKSCDPPHCEWDCDAKHFAATCVSWDHAKMFCAWAKKRLPSEAEWEKAARGTDGRKYPWGNEVPSCARTNMTGCGEKAKPVGSQPDGVSPYGALDMAGNVVEMLEDWYDPTYYQTAPTTDPKGPAKGDRYVGRGGGYKSKAVWHRASSRDWYDTYDQGRALGFRCAR